MTNAEFIEEVLGFCIQHDIADILYWQDHGKITPLINCNDVFVWACSDCEDITPENFDLFKKSVEECVQIDDVLGAMDGCQLFVARLRGMRPQGAAYPLNKDLWPLFDACGPPREIDLGNPCERGKYGTT